MAVAITEGVAQAQRRILNSFLGVSKRYLQGSESFVRTGCHTRGSSKLNGDRRAAHRGGLGRRNPAKQMGDGGRDAYSPRCMAEHSASAAQAAPKGGRKWSLLVGMLLLTMVVARA